MKSKSAAFLLIPLITGCLSGGNNKSNTFSLNNHSNDSASGKTLQVSYIHPNPVISIKSTGAEGIKYGFEGGRVVKVDRTYHLFTSEIYQSPFWVKMRLGYWISTDKVNWKRISTVRESSGEFNGNDPRAALWSPLPAWDEDNNEWNLFYVSYKSAPNTAEKFLWNHEGRIWRSVSVIKGLNGISGPYEDKGIILEPGTDSQSWEGLQGTDSFFPWKVGNIWYAFYGSAKTEKIPITSWRVGFATARALAGPWKRMEDINPAEIEKQMIENPIVTPVTGKGWLVVYDTDFNNKLRGSFGWGYSKDGVKWHEGNALVIDSAENFWCKDVRTPMGLVDEGNGKFTMFYSGFETLPDWGNLLTGGILGTCAIGYIELEFK